MAVVVDHGDVVHDALQIETAADAGKFCQAFTDEVRGNVQIERDRCSGGGVSHVMHPRRVEQTEQAEVFAAIREAELAVEALQLYVADDQVRLAGSAVGDDWSLHIGQNGLDVGLIEAEDRRAIKGYAVHELHKRALNISKGTVLVEVFSIDCSDNGNDGRKHQEAAIA